MEVRSIIIEALNRANIVPRRQPAPGDKVETGYWLLKAIVSQYNNDNFLAFTQSSIELPSRHYIHIFDQEDTMAGEFNRYFDRVSELLDPANKPDAQDFADDVWAMAKDRPGFLYKVASPEEDVYVWELQQNVDEYNQRYQQMKRYCETYHIQVHEVAKLNTLYVNRGGLYGMYKLNFLPRSEFDGYYNVDLYWTWTEGAEGEWLIEVKPYVQDNAAKLKLDYNRALRFDIDTDLRVPDAYIELLTVALTYKLAVKYPRLDDVHMARLEKDLGVMLENVSTPKADSKLVLRESDPVDWTGTPQGVLAGRMFV